MTVTVSGTTITFNDATTQTTAPVNTNANVTSVSAGSGISVSSTTGAITISATGGGTVTSVATGNGLQGGTITSSGTLSVACPSFNTVGSYVQAYWNLTTAGSLASGGTASAGSGNMQFTSYELLLQGNTNNLSGTWRWMSGPNGTNSAAAGIACRVS